MDFSDIPGEWQPIPSWVRFLINLGNGWPRSGPKPRRIALISMPCDSAAAGLIAVGAMVRDLADPRANDVDGHYDKLLLYARQFLESCESCDMKCKPEIKHCGHAKQATGKLRSPLLPHQTFKISTRTNFEERTLAWTYRNGVIEWPTPQYAINWHIEGEPPPEWNQPDGELSSNTYQALLDELTVLPENLKRSYSGLCFAGRAGGESVSRELCSSIRFNNGIAEYGLDELLTIHGWSKCNVSRIAFFNPRTEKLDRSNAASNLVIADGDTSFLKVCDHAQFAASDIIGVIHRNVERDRLEAVGAKILPNQWMSADTDKLCELPTLPRGISIAILKERGI
jgi:hypothetical protein